MVLTIAGHLDVTSCHLQCIEAPTRGAHSGVVRNELATAVMVAGLLGAAVDAAAGPASAFAPGASSDRSSGKDAIGDGRARVQVRVYDGAVMPVADQSVALRAAAGVLAAAGIDITWVECGRSGSAMNPAECDAPLAQDELAVRLPSLPAVITAHGELSLGYSLVDVPASAGALATVYVDRVEWLARQAGVDGATLLGHAIAHEIGHLLLGTNAHGAAGLMRAIWSRGELRRDDPADWLFTPAESLAMRRALERRGRQVQMASNIDWGR